MLRMKKKKKERLSYTKLLIIPNERILANRSARCLTPYLHKLKHIFLLPEISSFMKQATCASSRRLKLIKQPIFSSVAVAACLLLPSNYQKQGRLSLPALCCVY